MSFSPGKRDEVTAMSLKELGCWEEGGRGGHRSQGGWDGHSSSRVLSTVRAWGGLGRSGSVQNALTSLLSLRAISPAMPTLHLKRPAPTGTRIAKATRALKQQGARHKTL